MSGWKPRLIALDIDGTLLKRVDGGGTTHEEISPAVYDAVRRALDADVHVVLAIGRSPPHGMTRIADALDLHTDGGERTWIVASNGAVVLPVPPVEVIHEETFDAQEAVASVLEHHPAALVAVEERGVGYRVNRHFPPGEAHGEMTITEVDDLVAAHVSRVIIRDPDATAEDFVALGEPARPARHQLRGRLDGMARPRAGRRRQGLGAAARGRQGRRRGRGRARDRGRPQRHRDAAVGKRGVAMGQAVEEVRAAADGVTSSVFEDGAAVEIGKYFP